MKKKILIISSIVLLFASLNSCKKGEDDPFLSLLPRTQRLAGEWTLKSAEYTKQYKSVFDSTMQTEYYTFIDENYTKITKVGSLTVENKIYSYSDKIKIDKTGKYNETVTNDGENLTYEGIWTWINKNKENGLKNKEAILLTITKKIEADGATTYSGKTIYPDDIMIFKKLTNKEFVIQFDYSHPNDNYELYSYTGTMTYVKD